MQQSSNSLKLLPLGSSHSDVFHHNWLIHRVTSSSFQPLLDCCKIVVSRRIHYGLCISSNPVCGLVDCNPIFLMCGIPPGNFGMADQSPATLHFPLGNEQRLALGLPFQSCLVDCQKRVHLSIPALITSTEIYMLLVYIQRTPMHT